MKVIAKVLSKPFVFALLAACLAIALSACGGSGSVVVSGISSGGGDNNGGGSGGGGGVPVQVDKPTISTQPASQSVVKGSTATFTVTATGGGTLVYQWKKNGADIAGATKSTYTTDATSDADIGAGFEFSVVVSNSAGTITSSNASLAVTAQTMPPTIGTEPTNLSVVTGSTASFSVSATGTAPLMYQWKKNGTDIPGANSSTYTIDVTSNADQGAQFSVLVSNSLGTKTSKQATLTLTSTVVAPAITTQPAAQTIAEGQTATFSVTATGTAPGYQWKKNGTDIPGATSSTYTTSAASNDEIGKDWAYSVVISNSAGSVDSSNASLTVTVAEVATITTQPASQTVVVGQTASFSVVATGSEPLAYQWKKNGINIPGATASSYTTPAAGLGDDAAMFTVVVRNIVGTDLSDSATLTVRALFITTQPAAQSVGIGQTASFSVTAGGTDSISYQWKRDGINIPGATASTYTTDATALADSNAVFTVVVSNASGTVTSNDAKLTVSRYSLVANDSGGFYDKTECVKDFTTGLVWEGKPASGTRSGSNRYTNYDSTSSAQKWVSGTTFTNPTQDDIDASTNSIGYVNLVNAGSGLCGFTDWRRPTLDELQGILASSGNPRIDTGWFSNALIDSYWSSSPHSSNFGVAQPGSAWTVEFSANGYSPPQRRDYRRPIRLVRSNP